MCEPKKKDMEIKNAALQAADNSKKEKAMEKFLALREKNKTTFSPTYAKVSKSYEDYLLAEIYKESKIITIDDGFSPAKMLRVSEDYCNKRLFTGSSDVTVGEDLCALPYQLQPASNTLICAVYVRILLI